MAIDDEQNEKDVILSTQDIMGYCCVDGECVGFLSAVDCAALGGDTHATCGECSEGPEYGDSPCSFCALPDTVDVVWVSTSTVDQYHYLLESSNFCQWQIEEAYGNLIVTNLGGGNFSIYADMGSGFWGGITISGCPCGTYVIPPDQPEWMTGYLMVTFADCPAVDVPEVFDEVASGGVLVSGHAVDTIGYSQVASGGLLAAGSAINSVQTSLLGWWPLYDNRSDTNVIDVSGNSLNGTIAGGDNSSAISIAGPCPAIPMALDFDGTNDRISASGVMAPGTGSYTVLARFKCDAVTGYANGTTLFSMGQGSTATNGFRAVIISNLLFVECNDGAVAGRRFAFTDTASWHSVAMVIDRSTNKIIGYLDGSTTGSIAQNNAGNGSDNVTGNINTADPFRIGNRVNGATNLPFDGKLADVRVFNRALSSTEVLAYHNEQVTTGVRGGGVANVQLNRNPAVSGGARLGGSQKGLIPPAIRNKATRVWEGSTYVDRKVNETLTPANSPTIASGKINQAFSFPGSTNSYLQVARDNAAWYPTTGTLSYWWYIDFESNSGWGAANNVTSIVYDGNGLIVIRRDGGAGARLQLRNQQTVGSTSHLTPNGSFPAVTGWYHVVMQWTTGGSVYFWLNNVKYTATTTFPGFDTAVGFPTVRISTGGILADQKIEQLMLFDSALSDSEIGEIYYYGAGAYYSESFTQAIGGGATCGGIANVGVITSHSVSGGAVAGGDSIVSRDIPEFIAAGGLAAGGSSIPLVERTIIATGGLIASGESTVSRDIPEQIASGGMRAGGSAYVFKVVDVICGGAAVVSSRINEVASGGLLAGGSAVSYVGVNISGGCRLGGDTIEQHLINWHYQITLNIPAGRVSEDRYKQLFRVRIPTTAIISDLVVLDSIGNVVASEIRRNETDFAVLAIKANLKANEDSIYEVKYR